MMTKMLMDINAQTKHIKSSLHSAFLTVPLNNDMTFFVSNNAYFVLPIFSVK